MASRHTPPSGFHALFSLLVGALVPRWVHRHELVPLSLALVIWAGSLLFIRFRARRARGVFLDEEVELFFWLAVGSFLVGLLFVSSYYVVFG